MAGVRLPLQRRLGAPHSRCRRRVSSSLTWMDAVTLTRWSRTPTPFRGKPPGPWPAQPPQSMHFTGSTPPLAPGEGLKPIAKRCVPPYALTHMQLPREEWQPPHHVRKLPVEVRGAPHPPHPCPQPITQPPPPTSTRALLSRDGGTAWGCRCARGQSCGDLWPEQPWKGLCAGLGAGAAERGSPPSARSARQDGCGFVQRSRAAV
jgi:hypothetical protein